MNGKAHLLMGAASAAPLILATRDGWTLAAGIGLSMAASLAPDIDQAQHSLAINWPTKVGWLLRPRGRKPPLLVRLVFFWTLQPTMRGISKATRAASKAARHATATPHDKGAWAGNFDADHRALTHTGAAAILAGVAAGLLFGPLLGIAVFAGWTSHLLSDACTRAGVPLLWPIKRRGMRWHRVRLVKRLNLTSCSATDWRVAWIVVALITMPTVSLYALI